MGGGSPSHPTGTEKGIDASMIRLSHGNRSIWPAPDLDTKWREYLPEASSGEELAPTGDNWAHSALSDADALVSNNLSGREAHFTNSWEIQDVQMAQDLHLLDLGTHSKGQLNRGVEFVVPPTGAPQQSSFHAESGLVEEIAQQRSGVLKTSNRDVLQESNLAPTSATLPLQPIERKIFKLMEIQNDHQDLSFVEKVMLSQSEIFRLCNDIVAGSAKESDGRRIVDFQLLNSKSKKVLGFFGSKDVMREIFQKTEITELVESWKMMQNDTLAPGLYLWLHRNALCMFYWHQGHSLPEATRKDMSSNFIRYIFDLCDSVFVCFDDKNLSSALFANTPKFSKRQRTQRLQISLVKASEDSIKVTPGFLLKDPALVRSTGLPTGNSSQQAHEYMLSEGHNRIALLASFTRPRKLTSSKETQEMNVDVFPGFIQECRAQHHLDLTSLSDSDYVNFIRCAKLEQADEFEELLSSNERRKTEEKNKAYEVDQLVVEEQELLSRALTSFIYAFLKARYPWEEGLIMPVNHSAYHPMITAETGKQSVRSSGGNSSSSIIFGQKGIESHPSCPKESQDLLEQLEGEIYTHLVGKNSQQKLVFPTSQVHVYVPGSKGRTCEKTNGQICTVRCCGHNANVSSKCAPITYGSEVTIEAIRQGSIGTEAAKPVTIHRLNARDYGGPLLTDEEVICSSGGKDGKIIILKPLRRTGDLLEWLSLQAVDMKVPHLWNHAALLTATVEKLEINLNETTLSEAICRQILASNDPPEVLKSSNVSETIYEFARSWWNELQGLSSSWDSVESQQVNIDERIKILCLDLYAASRDTFQAKILALVQRFSTSLLASKIRLQRSRNLEKLDMTLKERERTFLAGQKARLSQKNGTSGLTLTVNSCRLLERSGSPGLVSWSRQAFFNLLSRSKTIENGLKVSMTFIRQELAKESITWTGSELAPMKEDLDQLVINPEYAFCPSRSQAKEIIDLDLSRQILLKVVFLKAGQLLVFIVEHSDLLIYLCPKLGMKLLSANCIKTMRRGFDLIAFDERSRFIALYNSSISTIKVFRFDEAFRHMDSIGVDIDLSEYAISRLKWMDFVPGKNMIVCIDDLHRVRLCEVTQPAMVRSGNVHLGHSAFLKACVTSQGSCLLILRNLKTKEQITNVDEAREEQLDVMDEDIDSASNGEYETEKTRKLENREDLQDGSTSESVALEPETSLMMDVYRLDDTIRYFTSIPVELETVKNPLKWEFGVVLFASQMHLVIQNSDFPDVLISKVIQISSASEVCHLEQVTPPDVASDSRNHPAATKSGPVLDYIYQIFEKYATSPPLISETRDLHLRLILKTPIETPSSSSGSFSPNGRHRDSLSEKCLEYVNNSINRLTRDKGKDFSSLEIHASVHDVLNLKDIDHLLGSSGGHGTGSQSSPTAAGLEVQLGEWIRRILCLVPIQIARAEHNALKPMVDGLQLSSNVDYVDAISLADAIRFGLYEPVLDSWTGPIKVISSMGKQSSGKSYLLNHLSGSLLDVAGGRCTDGVWMTVRHDNGCLYVLLDFEGLGSFERSEQEDMLLSILSAAISNLTIFNKKDFHLDKETEAIFARFQNGVTLVKSDAKLFKGLFYMAIKDVDSSDVEDLKKEFFSKISQICTKSQDNFLTKMYGGAVEISAMPSFNRPEFHDSIGDIGRTVEELAGSYLSGRSFLSDLKLIIAQISTKDWSPIDSKRVALRINLLRKHLKTATGGGCFFSDGMMQPLMQFDDHVQIPDEPLQVDGSEFPICDTALELNSFQKSKVQVPADILLSLMPTFKSRIARKGENDEEWHSLFEKFISALVLRRKGRVLQWIESNTAEFSMDGDIQMLQLEAVALLAEVQQNLLLCSCKCERCFLRCVQEKGHPSGHSCMGDHKCVAMCTYCLDEELESNLDAGPCNDLAGHDGPHDCREKSHTCGKSCALAGISSNCNANCSKKSGHSGDHQCNSRLHMCKQVCSLPSCKNPCVSPIDLGDHENHFCHEKFCPHQCSMTGCNRTCSTADHFHGTKCGVTHHFCGYEHPCLEKCEHKGNCEVLTEVSKKTQTFNGKRATFDYELVTEQNGNRKGCCLAIPANKDRHDGPHSHSTKLEVVHFCETRCPSCGYFCNRPIEHGGLHSTTHGNMRDVNFVAESEDIDILDRKYIWGESGVAELCQMHCKAQGRGHIHLIHCPADKTGGACRKLFDGAQHEMRKYGPDFDVPKDEMTHAAFWEFIRFEDPCNAEEQREFALCNHQCKSDEHVAAIGGTARSTVKNMSYCTESLWHQPIPKTDLVKFGAGYITDDGHHFSCDHSSNVAVNVIFIIDRSTSMGASDIRPSMRKFITHHNNRLGCVYEAILRFIRARLSSVQEDVVSVILFNHKAQSVISLQRMKESLVDSLLGHNSRGGTTYSNGLQHAEQILSCASSDVDLSRKSPVIIFLSDGGNTGGRNPLHHVGAMKALDPRLRLHTIMFGKDPSKKILEDMAKAGDGTFEVNLDEVQLSRRFEGLARSLRPQVASLL